ncbi:MAG TPA: aromatic ring-hydroxylating dioxygenase subunit alpha [Burkholderiaceae bacterium]|jgi:p-cumate 2,3-dioxygenase subunit alpha|nr:aromatic ring-hydroxylating dioxygenase subunit alpha [Burkholderiaceae bacterium]
MSRRPSVSETLQIDPQRRLFRVARSAYNDPAVFEAEMEALFSRCWLYVGHDTELAEPNRFINRRVGARSLIFLRDHRSQVRCFLNVCPHRGAQIVRHRSGSARTFSCIYHGWTFENSGRVLNIREAETYSDEFRSGCNDLVPVPRLEQYRGFWFVNYDAGACSLETYLGEARIYLDLVADQSELGMKIVGDPQEYSVRANWKLLAENSTDILHVETLHPTYLDLVRTNSAGAIVRGKLTGGGIDLGNGHAVVEREATYGRPVAQWISLWGEEARVEIERVYQRLVARFGRATADRIARRSRNLLIFPNLVINDIMSVTVRTFQPLAADYMEVTVWSLAPQEEFGTPALSRRMTNFLEFLGPAGFATPDDIEALESCQRAFAAWREAPWNDLSKGFGAATSEPNDELTQRVFWVEWQKRLLQTRGHPAPAEAR